VIRGGNVHLFQGRFALLVFLFRLANARTFRSMRIMFNREAAELCEIFCWMMIYMNETFCHLVDGSLPVPAGWAHPTGLNRWRSQLPIWHHAVNMRVFGTLGVCIPAILGMVCMFVDGTFRHVCRPGSGTQLNPGFFADLQRALYTRYKRGHGFQFQALSCPTGLVIDLWGPGPGRQNDLYLVGESDLTARLVALFNGVGYTVYGDSIYAVAATIVRAFRGGNLPQWKHEANAALNKERTSVHGARFCQIYTRGWFCGTVSVCCRLWRVLALVSVYCNLHAQDHSGLLVHTVNCVQTLN
jgi:hypothetical protein